MKSIISTCIIALILSSCFICRLSEQAIQEGLSQIQVAEATNTSTPTLTTTLVPVFTPTVTKTNSPTATQSCTPTQDLRIITIEPRDLLLTREDLPSEAQYFLPSEGWMSQNPNSDIISSWGVEEGEE